MNKITACYARVSSIEQKEEGYSIDVQKDKLSSYCSYKGFEDVAFFVDEGKSGGYIAKRPAMMELLDKLKKGEVQRIIVNNLSRFSRNLREFLDVIETMKNNKCEFISLTENIDTSSAQGRFFLNIMMSMNQWEREVTSERTLEIQYALVKEGRLLSKLPYGYKAVKKMIKGRLRVKDWLVDAEAASKVRQCFKLKLEGCSVQQIRKMVDLPYNSVKDMLRNEAYLGIQKYKEIRYKPGYEALVSDGDFSEVQNMAKS